MIVVHVPGETPQDVLTRIARLAEKHPGGHRLRVIAAKGPAPHSLTYGPKFSVSASARCLSALSEYEDTEVVEC